MNPQPLREAPWYLVYDLEATCDEGDPPLVARSEMETIEIGAVLVSGTTFRPVNEFQAFIRPVRRPRLTSFCLDLTGITQAQVDDAPTFPEVFGAFSNWAGKYPGCLWTSWGDFDARQLKRDCAFWKMEPPEADFYNLKRAFANGRHLKIAEALTTLKLGPMTGRLHRGIDDARNIARVLAGLARDQHDNQH